jgi:ribonuclease P protein component
VTLPVAPRLTFRRVLRLGDAADFGAALHARPVSAGPHFQVFRSPSRVGARLGIIVGKRFVSRAVDRNKLKRMIREMFRTRRYDLAASDHVVRVRDSIRSADTASLRVELENLLGLQR